MGHLSSVMPALVARIHAFLACLRAKDVDGRDQPGHDSRQMSNMTSMRANRIDGAQVAISTWSWPGLSRPSR